MRSGYGGLTGTQETRCPSIWPSVGLQLVSNWSPIGLQLVSSALKWPPVTQSLSLATKLRGDPKRRWVVGVASTRRLHCLLTYRCAGRWQALPWPRATPCRGWVASSPRAVRNRLVGAVRTATLAGDQSMARSQPSRGRRSCHSPKDVSFRAGAGGGPPPRFASSVEGPQRVFGNQRQERLVGARMGRSGLRLMSQSRFVIPQPPHTPSDPSPGAESADD